MGLREYNKKRDFSKTAEPKGEAGKRRTKDLFFCIQKHDATRLHYDFRLELDGVLKSWAVTKGPSLDPHDKRLAVRVEDHPMRYGEFEGIIPEGEYGGGTVMLWDKGTWTPTEDPHKGLKSGKLKFELHGEKMHGGWTLVHMKGRDKGRRENWLLIKETDAEAANNPGFLDKNDRSVKTKRSMPQIAKAADAVWGQKPAAKKPKAKPKKQAGKTKVGDLIKKYRGVQLATLADAPPQGDAWVHELKFDGYRLLGYIANGDVRLYTRNGSDWTKKFPDIADTLSGLDAARAIIDMEAVVLNEEGHSDFQALQNALSGEGEPRAIHAYAFDLLHLNGEDLRDRPLLERKTALEALIPKNDQILHYSEHHTGHGDDMIGAACRMGIEGIISKRADAAYIAKRDDSWQKVKCVKRQEFIILGYTDSKTGAATLGALHLGYYKGKKLHYAGKVGTGFTQASARAIYKQLKALPEVSLPSVIPGDARRGSHWVKPALLAEVVFGMWTNDGHIRHASFHALRSDKSPQEVTMEKPKHQTKTKTKPATKEKPATDNIVAGVKISHPEREVFADMGITKLELAQYYAAMAPYMLADIKDHPISLLRCPEGEGKECFFQRNVGMGLGAHIKAFSWTHKGKKHEYFYTDSAQGIVELIQMGGIELHPWGSPYDDIDHPDRIVFDLDPDPSVPFEAVKMAALDLKNRLENLGLETFLKCSGGKGLHVRVPLAGKNDWGEVKDFARKICEQMEGDVPEAYVTNMNKKKRAGKIFLDYLRNDYTATSIADYAVRARKGAAVAVPLDWRELKTLKSANAFTMDDVLKRIAKKKPDLRQYKVRQSLTAKILKSLA